MYTSVLNISINPDGYELREHGNFSYPIACYYNDMTKCVVIRHWHVELELVVVTAGVVKVGAGQSEKILSAGEGCFINSDVIHDVQQVGSREGILNSIVFHPNLIGGRGSIYRKKYLDPLIENKNLPFICFDSAQEKDSKIVSLISSAWKAEAAEVRGFEFDVRNFLSQIIFMISDGQAGKTYSLSARELRDMERTKLMIKFMESRFAENLTVAQIAEVAAISESECQRCFKRSTGITPIQFLKEYRILSAAEKIRDTQANISEIAEQCGFMDMSYFARSFRKIFKESPSDFRKNFGGGGREIVEKNFVGL